MRPTKHSQVPGGRGRMLGACLLACLLSALPLSAADTPVANARTGKQQSAGDELARARAAYSARPSDPEAALRLGLLLYRQDRPSLPAQRLLDVASRRLPQRHDVHLALLDSYLARKNATAATALLTRLQSEVDSSVRFALDVIYCLLQGGQLALAQAQWQKVDERLQSRATAPSSPGLSATHKRETAEAVFVHGLLATAAGRKAEALQLLRRADSQDFPAMDSPQMLMLADCFFLLEEYKLAAATYKEALAHFPENAAARWRYGLSLYSTSQLNEAVAEFEKLRRQHPRQREVNYYMGAALFSLKLHDRARACFERELALDPRCDQCMSTLGRLAYLAGDDQRATAWLDKAVALKAPSPETDLVYGMIANRAGRYDAAIRHLSRVVEQSPQDAQAHFQLALAYQHSGDAQKAQAHQNRYRQLSAPESVSSSQPAGK
jgi:tetratricopeptide (TPR) repeat protein